MIAKGVVKNVRFVQKVVDRREEERKKSVRNEEKKWACLEVNRTTTGVVGKASQRQRRAVYISPRQGINRALELMCGRCTRSSIRGKLATTDVVLLRTQSKSSMSFAVGMTQ